MHMSFSQERKETATGEKLFCSTIMFNWASQVARMEQDPLATAGDIRDAGSIPRLGRSLEKERAPHSSILAWEIPWTGKPGQLQSMGSQ